MMMNIYIDRQVLPTFSLSSSLLKINVLESSGLFLGGCLQKKNCTAEPLNMPPYKLHS